MVSAWARRPVPDSSPEDQRELAHSGLESVTRLLELGLESGTFALICRHTDPEAVSRVDRLLTSSTLPHVFTNDESRG